METSSPHPTPPSFGSNGAGSSGTPASVPPHLAAALPNRSAFEIQARFARTMGHPVRLQILFLLHQAEREVAVSHLLELLAIPKAALSQHLTKMVAVGLIRTRRAGRYVHVRLAHPEIAHACEIVRVVLAEQAREQDSMLNPTPLRDHGLADTA